jgi:hypothetical protein
MENPLDPRKSVWKKSWKSPGVAVLVLAVATFVILFVVGWLSGFHKSDAKFLAACTSVAIVAALVIMAIGAAVRWLRRPRNPAKALFGLFCIATFIALFYAEEDIRGKWAWNSFKRQWEARGEKFDLAGLTPPAVPNDQNFALTPIMFSTYGSMIDKTGHEIHPADTNVVNRLELNIYRDYHYVGGTNGNWAKGTLTDLRGWQNYYRSPTNADGRAVTNGFPTSPQPQSPAQDVLLALSKYDTTLEELRQASQMPFSRFPLEYDKEDPAAIMLPHLAKLKQSAQFLQLHAIAELQAGQSERAAADIKLACYLTDASRTEPFLITHLVRRAMLNLTLQPIYEGLAEHKWSEMQLASFDAELAQFDFLAGYQRWMGNEAAFTAREIDYLQHTRNVRSILSMSFDGGSRGFVGIDFVCWLCPSGWFHQNQIRISEFYLKQCVPVVDAEKREVFPKAAAQAQASLDESAAHPTPYNALLQVFYRPFKEWFFDKYVCADKFAHAQASVDLARVAIALERYKLAHGQYPESLDVLTAQFIQKLPRDVIGGQPLKYRRTNDSFVLYSIGWNEKDDGGVIALNKSAPRDEAPLVADPDNGDWVWAYPAR